jgi:hypothetical protein
MHLARSGASGAARGAAPVSHPDSLALAPARCRQRTLWRRRQALSVRCLAQGYAARAALEIRAHCAAAATARASGRAAAHPPDPPGAGAPAPGDAGASLWSLEG